jgi:hypothetical protein
MSMSHKGAALLVAGAAIAVALPVTVEAVDQTVDLDASVTSFCSFDADSVFSNLGNIVVDSPARPTSVVHIQDPVDSSGFMQDANFTYQILSTCNAPSQFTLTTQNGGLTNPAPPPVSGTWLNRIDYSAHLTLPTSGGATSSLVTNGIAGEESPLRTNGVAYSGNLQVSFQVELNTSAPMLAGHYSDILTIAVNPQ